ncbi:MAG: HD domain-containing protein [Xanthomonadaceae bacterium]|nr:HD domain-containing protein [Xanthomonadaceae bacterium]
MTTTKTTTQAEIRLTGRYSDALDYARMQHAGQRRKGTQIPYLSHLMGVSSLVLDHGGDEDQAIAGLLHDVIEDCGAQHETAVRERFGERVTCIVLACTDGTQEDKAAFQTQEAKYADWRRRKLAYLEHLRHTDADALLVSCCDKLHNARAIVGDLEDPAVGVAVFNRFTAGRDGTLRYYHTLGSIFTARGALAARALETEVARMHALTGAAARVGLDE